MKLSDEEKTLLEAQTPMQVSNYIMGSTDARKRPEETSPTTDGLMKILFKRMSSSSLSALAQLHGIQWDIEELVRLEKELLLSGIFRFKQFYGIDESTDILDETEWEAISETFVASYQGYIKGMELFMLNQMRNFVNKNKVLDLVLVDKFK
jgi:hypothetical protein